MVTSRQLPKPPLQRGAGKGSEIPRKTQLRDSSYLVKSRTGFRYFVTVISETSLGTSVRGGTLLRKQKSSRGSPQPGLLTTACFFSVFHPERSSHLIGFTLCSARREESTRREAAGSTERPRRVGREREEEAPEDSRGCGRHRYIPHRAEGTGEDQARTVLASPACHLLFRRQHLVAQRP